MPIGADRPSRGRNLPLALSIPVTVIGVQMRWTSWSMYDPSVDAKYFCSLTRNSIEFTKLAPALAAAALTPSSRSTLSLTGPSIAFFRIGVFQVTSPTPGLGAICTVEVWVLAFALAFATAWLAEIGTASLWESV